MIDELRKELKDDVWKVINKEEIGEKSRHFFFVVVLSLLLEQNSFSFGQFKCIVKKLMDAYNNALKRTNKLIVEDYGEVLVILKEVFKNFDKEIIEIMRKAKWVTKEEVKRRTFS